MVRWGIVLAAVLCNVCFAEDIPIPAPPDVGAKSYYLLDFSSRQPLAESNADERLEPASLTKLMTAYVVFKSLREGRIKLDDDVLVSEKAWRTPGSRMFIEVGTRVPVDQLLAGMIVQSGNDASVALAEHVAGSEDAFVDLMNQYANALGMTNTSYRNSTGLPAEGHHSTAHDSAILARAIIAEFPEYYHWYSQREFSYNGITQHNRNALLWRDKTVDGLKTGHTDAAGYCLVASADRSGMRLISVVMGTDSEQARAKASQSLLNYGFRFFETHKLYSAGEQVASARVWKGEPQTASLGLRKDLYVTVPRGRYDALSAVMDLPPQLVAPLDASATVGKVEVSLEGEAVASAPLVALKGVAEGSLWTRLKDEVLLWLE
jgi:D-alanyl-D-alanine carboxypeptidase (penicillin-binding protein 5/6)